MEQYISKSDLVAELEKRIEETKGMQPKFDQFWAGQISAFKGVLKILNTLEVKEIDTPISDSRKANHAKFIKELKQKIDSYERELSKSGDSTKCDFEDEPVEVEVILKRLNTRG